MTLALEQWVNHTLNTTATLIPLSGDAGFRRYFRFSHANIPYIAVDASHPTSSNPAFIFMAEHLRQTGLLAPEVKHVDLTQGFLVLSDLGDMTFLKYVNEKNADSLYLQALKDLVQIQKLTAQVDSQLPTFDDSFILRECGLFHEWFLQIHLQLELSAATQQMLQQTYQRLAELIAKQPNVCIVIITREI